MKKDSVYLKQILESVQKIRDFTVGMDREQFYQDQKTQSAVIMQLTLIGELAKKVSEATKPHIDLPWKEIAGFRDRAIHDYFKIDLQVVWDTVLEDLTPLEEGLRDYRET
jgi:uncharacterized protein with HEPN domain